MSPNWLPVLSFVMLVFGFYLLIGGGRSGWVLLLASLVPLLFWQAASMDRDAARSGQAACEQSGGRVEVRGDVRSCRAADGTVRPITDLPPAARVDE